MNLSEFIELSNAHPWAYVAIALNFAVVFINGWTDAPNSIATCISTKALTAKKAIIMAAICNLLGVLCIGFLSYYLSDTHDVSQTIARLVTFDPTRLDDNLIAVSSGLIAIICWSLGSTFFGFPSSESNELVGGITGAALALAATNGSSDWFANIGWSEWGKVLIGFFGSLVLGFLLGYIIVKLIELICRKMRRGATTRFFTKGEIVSSGLMAFVHGIQDGAKFIGVFIMIAAMLVSSAGSTSDTASLAGEWWIVVPVAVVMTLGTSLGGYKIIKTVGAGMATLQKYQGFATDIASTIGLLLATFYGLPVSTGTVKATSIVGSGAAKSWRKVHWDVTAEMVGSWILIFPGTALIGFIFTLIFASIF
jgi:inorganic phosphate transporter, PiT family